MTRAIRALAAVVVAFVCLLFTTEAAAQITVVNEASLPRLKADGSGKDKRSITLSPEAVNLQDCLEDQRIRFTLQMAGFEANATVQAWASNSGASCNDPTARSGGVQTCWDVLGRNIGLLTVQDVELSVRSIMSGAPPNSAPKPNNSIDVCGQVDLSTITVHFLYFPPGNSATASFDKPVNITIDTVGPSPPTGLRALPGNTRVQVTWDNISGEGGLTELTGVNVYCDVAGAVSTPVATDAASSTDATTTEEASCTEVPNDATTGIDDSGDAIAIDAGTSTVCTDGGTSSSSSSSGGSAPECASGNFVLADGGKLFPNNDFNTKYGCGGITGNSGTTAVATTVGGQPLANGTKYAVAVAATDKYGNAGPLSTVVCETPELTTDFWEDYKKAGGDAGGGCKTNPNSAETPIGAIGLLVGGVLVGVVRKRMKNKTKATKAAKKSTHLKKKKKEAQ